MNKTPVDDQIRILCLDGYEAMHISQEIFEQARLAVRTWLNHPEDSPPADIGINVNDGIGITDRLR